MKHSRQSCYDDHLGPDPYEVIRGFRQLPVYRCENCYDRRPDVTDRYVFDDYTGRHEAKMLCDECWEKVRNT